MQSNIHENGGRGKAVWVMARKAHQNYIHALYGVHVDIRHTSSHLKVLPVLMSVTQPTP